jgi:hypothetical protein
MYIHIYTYEYFSKTSLRVCKGIDVIRQMEIYSLYNRPVIDFVQSVDVYICQQTGRFSHWKYFKQRGLSYHARIYRSRSCIYPYFACIDEYEDLMG